MKVALCTPKRHMTLAHHFSSLIQLASRMRELGHELVFFQQVGCALLEHGRSSISTEAYEWGAEVQLFVDDDVVIGSPDSVIRLCEEAMKRESLVAAPTLISGGSRFNVSFLEENPFDPRRVVKASHCGMGCTAFHLSVVDRIVRYYDMKKVTFLEGKPKVLPLFRSILNDAVWLGEDTSFCHRAIESSGEEHVWADTRCMPTHWGIHPYSMSKFEF